MIIYKITNKINNKVYIGQTTRTLKARFDRHIQDSISNRLDTHFARAIRKYGKENFYIEQIDSANTQEELNKKEVYWIKYYNSIKTGYNMAEGSLGGNTYIAKTDDEMSIIKDKIKKTKIGGNNPMARAVKCKNVFTGEEIHFQSSADAKRYFNETNHNFVTKRCKHIIYYLYKGIWQFAYEEDEYSEEIYKEKKARKAKKINVKNNITGEQKDFVSYAQAERYFGLKRKELSGHANRHIAKQFTIKDFTITILD